MSEFLTLDELAERWKVDRNRVKSWFHRGSIPKPIRLSPRHWLWPRSVIEEFEARWQAAPQLPTEEQAVQ